MDREQSPLDYFRFVLLTVVGQAFEASGYRLDENPVQWAGGLFRFSKPFENGLYGFIEFQLLNYADTIWSSGHPSRFRVMLTRSDQPIPTAASLSPFYVRRTLGALVVQDFGVAILPSPDHWWEFRSTQQLGSALAEAGYLIVGYGIPWLAGDLLPPSG